MAGKVGIATIQGVSTGSGAVKTLLQLECGVNHPIKILEVGIFFHGVNNTHEPIDAYLAIQSTAGTMTGLTVNENDEDDSGTFDTVAQHTATVEPTTGVHVRDMAVHPQTGLIFSPNSEAQPKVSSRVGLVIDPPNGTTVDAYIVFEE